MIVQFWEIQQTFSTSCSVCRFLISPPTLFYLLCSIFSYFPKVTFLQPSLYSSCSNLGRTLHNLRLGSIYLLEYNSHHQWKRNKEGENASALRPHCLHTELKLNLHSPRCHVVFEYSVFPLPIILLSAV